MAEDQTKPKATSLRVSTVDPVALTRPASDPPGRLVVQAESADPSDRPPPSKVDPYVGKVIDGRYAIERVLGEGGMGVVYLGRHKVIDKKVAIKVLRGEMAKDKEITERFLQEARAASSIGNAHIVDISDFGTLPDGSTYFVMEFLDGDSLSAALERERPMPVPRILHLAKQIASGLSAAHAAGIVHRDLKPDNVMLINRGGSERDFVKILDFGIAKVGAESKITRQGSVFGTPHYMSPEQAAGTSVDLRTDVYALGVILYELASGGVPFDADNFMGILTQHMYKAPVPILALQAPGDGGRSRVPVGFDAVIQKCLSKRPEQRYATMAALLTDLEKVERGAEPDALPEMVARPDGFHVPADYFRAGAQAVGGARSRAGVFVGIAAAVAVVGALAAGFFFLRPGASRGARPDKIVASVDAVPVPPPPPASAAPQPPPSKEVLFVVEPTDAKVTRDGADLGSVPIAIALKDGESAALVVTRAGYKTQNITIDGTETKMLVKLTPAPSGKTSKPTPSTKAAPAATGGITDFQDPFLKK